MDISGKRVLVAGGSGVLGRLIAAELAGRGARVALTGRDAGRLAAAAAAIPGGAPTLTADLGDAAAPARAVAWMVETLGGIDGVVNAAGVVAFGPLAETDPAALREVVSTDLLAPLALIGEAIPHIDEGFVVNLSGVVAEQIFPGMAPYLAAKTGLSAATRALTRELRRSGILVIDARPPHTETGLAERPVAGTAPRFPAGLAPQAVARRIVDGIVADEAELPSGAFA
jgi:cyclic-di-GMP-binding biofilm dispersal mediator protein